MTKKQELREKLIQKLEYYQNFHQKLEQFLYRFYTMEEFAAFARKYREDIDLPDDLSKLTKHDVVHYATEMSKHDFASVDGNVLIFEEADGITVYVDIQRFVIEGSKVKVLLADLKAEYVYSDNPVTYSIPADGLLWNRVEELFQQYLVEGVQEITE